MIKDFKPRLYQETILASCVLKNTMVVLPTGMGKTNVFLMLAAQRLKTYPNEKILLIGPTKPLISQYMNVFLEHFEVPKEEIAIFTGMVKPEKREALWKQCKVIFSTPQGLENDIVAKRISLKEVSLLGIDEAHRAVGNYAYVWVAKQYMHDARHPRIIAMTASPGSDFEKITEVCTNLHIEAVEVRTDQDPDVKPYIQQVDIDWVHVHLSPGMLEVKKLLDATLRSKLVEAKGLGYIGNIENVGKRELLGIQGHLQGEIAKGNREMEVLKSISLCAEAMKVQHALELLETQGLTQLQTYMKKIVLDSFTSKVKAIQNLGRDLNFKSALIKTEKALAENEEHPKIQGLKSILEKSTGKQLIFTQFRDTGKKLVEEMNMLPNIKASLFVGQAKKAGSGLTQKEQIAMIEDFKKGTFNTLVMTSVGEEGLDIPQVETVIFYEPIPSAIRQIQRRGRTGRKEKGKVIMMITKNTRDEGYRWSAHHKEKRMYRVLNELKTKFTGMRRKQETLDTFNKKDHEENGSLRIIFDHREKTSRVIKECIELGINMKGEQLECGDYLCSKKVGVEYKTIPDFINSLIDGRLLMQIKELKQNFEKPLLIIEGEQDLFSVRNIHPNAIRGLLATILIDYQIPITYTKNPKETAAMLQTIAKREQTEKEASFNPHAMKKPMSKKEQQEYMIGSLPGIGPTQSKNLLKKLKSIKNIVNANKEDLTKIEKIGDKSAQTLLDIFNDEYKE